MSKKLKVYFIVMTILSAISLLFPVAIFIGLFLFLIPGYLLIIAPTILFYSILAHFIYRVLESKWNIRSTLGSLLLSMLIGVIVSMSLNSSLYFKVKTLKGGDLNTEVTIAAPTRSTIALLTNKEFDGCSELCFRMLFSGTAQRVIIGHKVDSELSNLKLPFYELDDSKSCNLKNVYVDRHGYLRPDSITIKALSGNCVKRGDVNLKSADIILNIDEGMYKKHVRDKWRLDRARFFYWQVELIERNNGYSKTLYKKTSSVSDYFFTPLSFGTNIFAGGGGIDVSWGFYHLTKKRSDLENIEKYLSKLFPDAFSYNLAPSDDEVRLVTSEILLNSKYIAEEKERFYHRYVMGLRSKKRKGYKLTDQDMYILSLGIKSNIKDYWELASIVRLYGDEPLLPMKDALFEKLLASDSERTVRSIASVLSEFSKDNLEEISDVLSKSPISDEKMMWIREKSKGKF